MRNWPQNVLVSLSRTLNSVMRGDPDMMLSAEMELVVDEHGGIPWYLPIRKVLYRLLETIRPGHCYRCLDDEQERVFYDDQHPWIWETML